MYRRPLLTAVALTALCLILLLPPAFASVDLVYFKAEETGNNRILVTWETATERDMIGFKLYRSLTNSPAEWVDLIPEGVPIKGNAQGGGQYFYEDQANIEPGRRYYYLLREVTNNGKLVDLAQASAGIGLPADTPTPTATATWTKVATATSRATGSPTVTPLQPTATRRFTDGPPTAAPGTPSPRGGTTVVAVATPPPTPLAGARVATPTGIAPRVTIPAAAIPTADPFASAGPLLSPLEPTPTPALVAANEGTSAESPTPLPTKDATPVIFSSDAQSAGSPTPEGAEQVAGQGGGRDTLALAVAGGAIGLAGLLAAVFLFLRSRRS